MSASLVLTHLQPWNGADDALAEAAAVFDGKLAMAVPGQVLNLAR